eukprot:m51a1_g4885 putative nitrilase cyanide hydratase and apolipoprotein n-acyltransferase (1237) ;mRNA; r:46173-65013
MSHVPCGLVLLGLAVCFASASLQTLQIAAVHFGPRERDVADNANRLEALCRRAAQMGARLVVTPEMSLTGYSFWSRSDVAVLAQTLDSSPVLGRFKNVASEARADILLGLPLADERTGLYYNSAVLVLGSGGLGGHYAKMNHLLESSYNAESFRLPMPMGTTSGVRVAVLICADSMRPLLARTAALLSDAAQFQVMALENDIPVVVANRHGATLAPTAFSESLDQDTLVLRSGDEPINFTGAETLIVSRYGSVVARTGAATDDFVTATIDVDTGVRRLPVARRPELYSLLAHGTVYPDGSAVKYSGLPPCANFSAAALRIAAQRCGNVTEEARVALARAAAGGAVRLVVLPAGVYPENCTAAENEAALAEFTRRAVASRVDVVATFGDVSVLATSDNRSFAYTRTHARTGDNASTAPLGGRLVVVNRPYARVALLHGVDFLVPEVPQVLSRMAVDVVAVAAADEGLLVALAGSVRAHSAMLHVVVANSRGKQGVYRGDWVGVPQQSEDTWTALLPLSSCDVRDKFSVVPHNFDASVLLRRAEVAVQSSSAQDSSSREPLSSPSSSETGTTTPASCGNSMSLHWVALNIGNKACNIQCYSEECNWDGGDCNNSQCSPGCTADKLANDVCDPECSAPSCSNDNGRCKQWDMCATKCHKSMIDNGVCDRSCITSKCKFDGGDCAVDNTSCAPQCAKSDVGNKWCNLECNVSQCNFDGGDCKVLAKCDEPRQWIGNGLCNHDFNTKATTTRTATAPKKATTTARATGAATAATAWTPHVPPAVPLPVDDGESDGFECVFDEALAATPATSSAKPAATAASAQPCVCIKNVAQGTTEEEVLDAVEQRGCANAVSVRMPCTATGQTRGIAFVTFRTLDDAQTAIERLKGLVLNGEELLVQMSRNYQREEALERARAAVRSTASAHESNPDVFVKNLAFSTTDADLVKAFKEHGCTGVRAVQLARKDGKSRGFGFVTFRTRAEALEAVERLNGTTLADREISLELSTTDPFLESERGPAKPTHVPREVSKRLYVVNLPFTATEELLREAFERKGCENIVSVEVPVRDGKSQGFAFLNFKTHQSAVWALDKMNGELFGSRTMSIEISTSARATEAAPHPPAAAKTPSAPAPAQQAPPEAAEAARAPEAPEAPETTVAAAAVAPQPAEPTAEPAKAEQVEQEAHEESLEDLEKKQQAEEAEAAAKQEESEQREKTPQRQCKSKFFSRIIKRPRDDGRASGTPTRK